MALDLSKNHFALFGLPERFELASEALERTYRDLQAQVHPDRFAHASEAEKRISMQWATRVNEAFQTLRASLSRARYLLELRGVDLGVEDNTAMPADFLMAQLEWRESIEEAADDVDALDALSLKLGGELKLRYEALRPLLDEGRDADAAVEVRKLMFLEKLRSEIDDAIAVAVDD